MDHGDWLTRATAWIALSFYAGAELVKAAVQKSDAGSAARWMLTIGCAFFFVHVACAFGIHHHWSHAAAYADTARQTAQFTGWNWGGGLYFNYLFALVWFGETIWSWANPSGYYNCRKWITGTVRGFFLFMIFNGTVVFVHGMIRWYGTLLCLILAICWWHRKNRRQQ